VLVAKEPTGGVPRGGVEEHDAASGCLPCTGRGCCSTSVRLSLFTVQTDDVT
jgi:hypothetical protein